MKISQKHFAAEVRWQILGQGFFVLVTGFSFHLVHLLEFVAWPVGDSMREVSTRVGLTMCCIVSPTCSSSLQEIGVEPQAENPRQEIFLDRTATKQLKSPANQTDSERIYYDILEVHLTKFSISPASCILLQNLLIHLIHPSGFVLRTNVLPNPWTDLCRAQPARRTTRKGKGKGQGKSVTPVKGKGKAARARRTWRVAA